MFVDWFRSGPDLPRRDLATPELRSTYQRTQWGVFVGLVLGYSFFYTTRLSLSVVKGPMLEAGVVTKEALGFMGSALFATYAVGKFANGFLADHADIRKFMSFGLAASALINLALGCAPAAWLFVALWGLNGWFQSMGSAPSCVSIYQWFPARTRGTFYSVWAGSHNIGEGITFVLLPVAVGAWGWQGGFLAPGLASLAVAGLMVLLLRDRPEACGLPPPEEAFSDPGAETVGKTEKTVPESGSEEEPGADASPEAPPAEEGALSAQLFVLRSPTVWIIALACAGMYISRYAINSWAILYLQEARGYTLQQAGVAMAAYPMLGLLGAVLSGALSDHLFASHRPAPATLYGFCNVGGMALLFYGPGTSFSDAVALGVFGFGIGGLIVFLAGLMAADLMPKKAVGATKGFIGLFAYLGAAAQESISAALIRVHEVGGEKVYDFDAAIQFWIGAGVVSMILVLLVWNARPVEVGGEAGGQPSQA